MSKDLKNFDWVGEPPNTACQEQKHKCQYHLIIEYETIFDKSNYITSKHTYVGTYKIP